MNEPLSKRPSTRRIAGFAIVILIGLLCFAGAVCLGGFALLGLGEDEALPVYAMEQTDSIHEGYRRTTLTHGSTVYVSDYEESALGAFGENPTQMIGRLPVSEDAVSGIYAIPGQDPSAYVLEYDPMYQQVYRNLQHPPFVWHTADFQMMRLGIPTGPAANKETTDSKVIDDVVRTLIGAALFIVPLDATGNYADYQNYQIQMFTDELPGLVYLAGLHIGADGQVYLAENAITNQWHPAGSIFLDWMN
ncbi:MAG: hypothetical protein MHPDNHAH_00749 [Anaerolineales bacterium]|nr:hypothetical protein [Anaerolineales bacterium]WKZ46143.1 MAG: hypothetical protein QY306_10020 [Anaerolineales bacterium]